MKLNLPALVMILVGAILINAAYKNKDPRNVVFGALGIKMTVPDPVPSGTSLGTGTFTPHTKTTEANTPGVTVVTV